MSPIFVDTSPSSPGNKMRECLSDYIKYPLASTVPELAEPAPTISALKTDKIVAHFIQNHTKSTEMEFTGDILSNIPVFFLTTPSVISSDSMRRSTTTTALEMQSTTASFTQKVEKVEKSDIFTQAIPLATRCLHPHSIMRRRHHISLLRHP